MLLKLLQYQDKQHKKKQTPYVKFLSYILVLESDSILVMLKLSGKVPVF